MVGYIGQGATTHAWRPDHADPGTNWELYAHLHVVGRLSAVPAADAPWREAVRESIFHQNLRPALQKRFFVQIKFMVCARVGSPTGRDIDNLVKPTLDAMDGIFGGRKWEGLPQAADDQVDGLYVEKVVATRVDLEGAEISVFVRSADLLSPRIIASNHVAGRLRTDSLFGTSSVRASLLRLLLREPQAEIHVRELARRVAHNPAAVSRALGRLQRAGLVTSRQVGRSKVFRIALSSDLEVLTGALSRLEDKDRAPNA